MLRCDKQLKPRASSGDGGALVAEQAPRTQGARWHSLLGAVPVCAEVWHVIRFGVPWDPHSSHPSPDFATIKHLPYVRHSAQATSPSAYP